MVYQVSQKKFTHLAGYGIKSMQLIFKTEISIYQSKANLDEKILFGKIHGKISRHLDPEIKKMPVRCVGISITPCILVYNLLAIEIKILFLKLTM